MSKKIEDIIAAIMSASTEEMLKIIESLKEKFGISSEALMATNNSNSSNDNKQSAEEEESAVYSITCNGLVGDIDQLKVLKVIKEFNGMGYVDIKTNIIEKVKKGDSVVIKEGLDLNESKKISETLTGLNLKVEFKKQS
ncbi:hypothetical protein AB836_01940 [Rickettsiales bacterium (ex Bugula neritina AB1)]|nr:hypothetical protein AB836_01940 [Rickettsiales bacterium (ex Bugula neritina AB1)]